ncbi:putative PH domain-containing protein [Erysiphe neolycopersici]|uniref:Putative PH domain-containing protein n=1 Tax=Erysiphe neolycopersici TaxID=212602 RepID=A0A420I5F0_9PEZI|nr:putative PH domain-containing protein [Erysiphe neolycopersici]
MEKLFEYLLVYIIGGLTFPFILIATFFVHAYVFLSIHNDTSHPNPTDSFIGPDEDVDLPYSTKKPGDEKLESWESSEAEVLGGYFAVSRDFKPGGINGQPLERITPTGSTVVSAPSQSVYQSMYRSIFERKANINQHEKSFRKPLKKGSNIFFVVLRHGHLILFDDSEQLEVRHVISLANFNVSIYAGGNDIPEGELFIKRNALCLSRRRDVAEIIPDGQTSKPFYLFSENSSNKEDFYFALLRNQKKHSKPLQYEINDIISLAQKLHSSEEHIHTRWLNAIIGRIFLALYKTSEMEEFFRAKIKKKISRVKTPGFLSEIVLQNINLGESAPIITNPKLKDLTINGELVVEADLRYSGNFRIEVAAIARIDLGAHFKAREVNLLLAVNLKKIEGHILLKIKPPPSNRLWMCFQTQPRIDMNIEPIVSSRQITYTLILRQIESRIKEVVAESLVYPNWDDSPFFGTENKLIRGGIWENNFDKNKPGNQTQKTVITKSEFSPQKNLETEENKEENNMFKPEREDALLLPLEANTPNKLVPPLSSRSNISQNSSPPMSLSSHKLETSLGNNRSPPSITEKSKILIPSSAYPISPSPSVSTDSTTVDAHKGLPIAEQSHVNAAFLSLSEMKSSLHTAAGASITPKSENYENNNSSSSKGQYSEIQPNTPFSMNKITIKSEKSEETPTKNSITEARHEVLASSVVQSSTGELKRLSLATVNNAAATAKKWGWNALHRNFDSKKNSILEGSTPRPLVLGRGQPLPPPVPKRKSVPIHEPTRDSEDVILHSSTENSPQKKSFLPPLELIKRNPGKSKNHTEDTDDLLIVPLSVAELEEGSEDDLKSSTNLTSDPLLLCDSSDQIFLGSSEDDDSVIPSWVTTPEPDDMGENMFK